MSVIIRKATIMDSEVISCIHASSWKATYKGIVPQRYLDELKYNFWVDAFQSWISNNLVTAQLIYENEIPVGCIAYGKSRDERFLEWGEIVSIYLLPEYCSKGYGQRLIKIAIDDLNTMGFQNCYLWVLKDNLIARRFYEKNGFWCNNDEYNFEIMQKPLTDVRYISKCDYNK
jgi:ribosomal protein S18 acetylase RimI-like enzyme